MSAEQIEGRGASGDGLCSSPDEGELRDRLREARAHAEVDPGEGLPLVASLCHEQAWDLLEEGLLSDAETLVREELAAVRFLAANDPETFLPRAADACENLAGILWEGGDPAEAEPLYREALSLRRSLAGRDPAGDILSEAAHTCVGLARLLEEREPGEAEELYREALSLRRSLTGQDPAEGPLSEVASSCVDLALFLEDLGRLEEAEPLVLVVPDRVSTATEDGRDGERAVEEKMFALALRQRVNAAIIHHASATLPDGRRITASVRRRPDGVLYSVTDPPVGGGDADRELGLDDIDPLTSLEDRVRDAVGLPTT